MLARPARGRLSVKAEDGYRAGFVEGLIDALLPRRCVACGATGAWLCPSCSAQLVPLVGPHCRRCARPLDQPARTCIECRGRDLAFVSAAAAFSYEGPARQLVAACKFRRLRSLTLEMAALAAQRFTLLASTGGPRSPFAQVTWVPTTKARRLERGFDQAELLARALAKSAGLPAGPLLARVRASGAQSRLNRLGRAGNVRGAFACVCPARVSADHAIGLRHREIRVLIVDDVYTTGETLNECASALSGAGYEAHVFTFARTVRGQRL